MEPVFNLQTDFYMIMSRNDWFHQVVTQMIFFASARESRVLWYGTKCFAQIALHNLFKIRKDSIESAENKY